MSAAEAPRRENPTLPSCQVTVFGRAAETGALKVVLSRTV
jgi:hypothetical protein